MFKKRFMPTIMGLAILSDLSERFQSKTFGLCELAKSLYYDHAVSADQLAMWLCIAYYESAYNTTAVGPHAEDFGIFQISRLFWCDPRQLVNNSTLMNFSATNLTLQTDVPNVCNVSCSAFLDDDIEDDVICAKRIYREHNGFEGDGYKAWAVYPRCQRMGPLVPEWCFPEGEIPLHLSSKAS